MFTKHCSQPALRSCGFLRTVCMTCRAIMNCQPSYHHCLPSLACQPPCTSPAFSVVRRTWDAAIPTDSRLSSQSLLLPLDIAVTNFELLTRIGKNLRYFQGQAVFFLLHGYLLNLPPCMAHLSIRKNPCLFQWFNRDGSARPSPRVLPSITTN